MKRKSLTLGTKWLAMLAFVLATGVSQTMAQDTAPPPMSQGPDQAVHMNHIPKTTMLAPAHNLRSIAATVTKADAATGLVDVMAGGMALRVYFSPTAVAALKAGDRITLYMGFDP